MLRLIVCTAGCAVAASLFGSPAAEPRHRGHDEVVVDGDCTVIRQLPNGQRIVTPASQRRGHGSHRSAQVSAGGVSASSSGGGSSVSLSSSSREGRGHAVASSSSGGRTVTTTHDGDGCTIEIDDRGRRGDRR